MPQRTRAESIDDAGPMGQAGLAGVATGERLKRIGRHPQARPLGIDVHEDPQQPVTVGGTRGKVVDMNQVVVRRSETCRPCSSMGR